MPDIKAQNETALASVKAIYDAADEANTLLDGMQTAATQAGTTLNGIYADAENAQQAADNAQASAIQAHAQLSVVEDVVGTVTWLANHGYYVLSEDDSVVANKVYYTVTATVVSSPMGNPSRRLYYERSGTGTTADPYIYVKSADTAVVSGKTYYTLSASSVSEPSGSPADNLYYELALDEAVGNYIATHLALTDNGLDLYGSDTMGRLRLTANGIEIYGAGSQSVIAEYGSTTRLGSATGKHVTIDSANGFVFWAGDENNAANKVAWFTDNQLNIPNAIVSDTIETGNWRWDASSNRARLDLKYIG